MRVTIQFKTVHVQQLVVSKERTVCKLNPIPWNLCFIDLESRGNWISNSKCLVFLLNDCNIEYY